MDVGCRGADGIRRSVLFAIVIDGRQRLGVSLHLLTSNALVRILGQLSLSSLSLSSHIPQAVHQLAWSAPPIRCQALRQVLCRHHTSLT